MEETMSEPVAPRYLEVPGSERPEPLNATLVGPADPAARVQVSVYLRPRAAAQAQSTSAPTVAEQPLSREEFAARFGADPADIARVAQFAQDHRLSVVESSIARRVIVLSGTVADLNAAFQVDLRHYTLNGTTFRGRTGHVYIPAELSSIVTGVFGLDERPQAGMRLQSFRPHTPIILAVNASPAVGSLQFPDRRPWAGSNHRHHRAWRRLPAERPGCLLQHPWPCIPNPRQCPGRRRL